MANTDPTGDGRVVTLKLSDGARDFLQGVFWDVRDGIRADLAEFPDTVPDPGRLLREAIAYDSLLIGLVCGSIIPNRVIREALCVLADVIDAGNEYDRVVAEHAALLDLRDQLGGACR